MNHSRLLSVSQQPVTYVLSAFLNIRVSGWSLLIETKLLGAFGFLGQFMPIFSTRLPWALIIDSVQFVKITNKIYILCKISFSSNLSYNPIFFLWHVSVELVGGLTGKLANIINKEYSNLGANYYLYCLSHFSFVQ